MPKKKTDLNALVRKTDIEGLVRWKPEPTDIARVDEVRQGFIGLEEDLTYSEVHGKYPTEIKVDDDDSVMALVRSRAEIVARHDVDSLEGLRRESGLDIHLPNWYRPSIPSPCPWSSSHKFYFSIACNFSALN